jgi:hypothetical protein
MPLPCQGSEIDSERTLTGGSLVTLGVGGFCAPQTSIDSIGQPSSSVAPRPLATDICCLASDHERRKAALVEEELALCG